MIRSRAWMALLLAAWTSSCYAAAPAVALISRQFTYFEDYDTISDLRQAGFEVGVLSWAEVSAESLRPFNAVVLCDLDAADEQGRLPAATQRAVEAVWAWCRAGGGVLACMGTGGFDSGRRAANVFLKPFGAELLDEQVTDPEHRFRDPHGIRWLYGWTTNVAEHPATEGVKTVFYPAMAWRADSQKTLYAPKVSGDWQVIVRGEKTARSITERPRVSPLDDTPASYAAEPPMVTVRDVDQGRLAILALWPNWTFWGAHRPSMSGIVWSAGAAGLTSDTGKLCTNLVRWLAAPSLEAGQGGFTTPEKPEPRPSQYEATPVDWTKLTFEEPEPWQDWRVLAGPRTRYTTGAGTVADYCRAARAAGYRAVLFAEPLEELTADEWNQLRRDCAAATDDGFLALPGLDFTSLQGDQYVAFGEFEYPKPPGLAADGKHVDDTYQLWFGQMHAGFIGATRLHRHPERDPQILKTYTAVAVQTWSEGKLSDDSLDHYLALDAQFHNLVPFSLHLLTSPDQVAAAAKQGLQTVYRVAGTADLKEQIVPHRQMNVTYWLNPHRVYLTSGPALSAWDGLNQMYWGPATPGSDRFKIRFRVSAPNGVKEVAVWDRARPVLRYAGDGQNLERVFAGHHDDQHVFHLRATDNAGGELLAPGIRVRFSQAYINQCGDHQNFISSTLQRNRKGRMIYTGGTTRSAYAGWIPFWSAPCSIDPTESYPPAWDGVVTGTAGKAAPALALADGREGGEELSCANLFRLAGPEVQILDQVVRHKYPAGTPPRGDCKPTYRTVPTENFDVVVRRVTPTARFERAGISFNTVTIRAKQDLVLDPKSPQPVIAYAFSDYGSRKLGEGDHVFVSFADGRAVTRVGLPGARAWHPSGTMTAGNYVAAFPNPDGAGAVYPLTETFVKVALNDRLFGAVFGLPPGERKLAAGESLEFRFLAASAATAPDEGNELFDGLRRSLGLGCAPLWRAEPRLGKVVETTGRLLAEADSGAFATKIGRTIMPADLFVEVRGLTDGWTAARQLNGKGLELVTVHEGVGYTNLDLAPGDQDMVIGHPVLCSDRRVRLVVWWTGKSLTIWAHNPTAEGLTVELRPNPGFAGLPPGGGSTTIPAGDSRELEWRG